MAWQQACGYNKRTKAEAAIGRWKQVIGGGLRSRLGGRRATGGGVAVGVLNRMLNLERPGYSTPRVSWDMHSRSAGRSLWHPER